MRRAIDICMTVLLLFLMAYQVTGEALHEWIGIGMTVLVIAHITLNRRWYRAVFRGRYNPYRRLTTAVNILLLLSFAMTPLAGMSMSAHAVPFLYGMFPVSFARRVHLAMSHWSFVLMGIHLGLHIPVMTAKMKIEDKTRTAVTAVLCFIAGIGALLFLRSGWTDYMFFRSAFAFLDYEKAGALVLLENLLMLIFWAFTGDQMAELCRKAPPAKKEQKTENDSRLIHVIFIIAAIMIGMILNLAIPGGRTGSGDAGWDRGENSGGTAGQTDRAGTDDVFIPVEGGSFMMGSPESENWRIEDELQHEVAVSSFYADPYETTQADYEKLTGSDPSSFRGEKLPVENISWLDAVRYANARSEEAGLTPACEISSDSVSWDMSADGYRLPTEAEWEYVW